MKFKEQIFMGNGDHSLAACYQATLLLQKSLDLLNGMQQEGLQGYEVDQERYDAQKSELYYNTSQLVVALTGHKINFSKLDSSKKEEQKELDDDFYFGNIRF